MKTVIFQINVVANSGSTGRIAEKIGMAVLDEGWDSYIAYGRWACPSKSHLIRIGNRLSVFCHGIGSRLLDRHGYFSRSATNHLIKEIQAIKPDIIHLHNIHGYYLNFEILFQFLASYGRPVVWTLHDCWSYTGHCSHYTAVGCEKWKELCYSCPNISAYPRSFIDNTKANYLKKKTCFTGIPDLHIVTVSDWLHKQVDKSFLNKYPITTISNGINTDIYKPTLSDIRERLGLEDKFIILSVASYWNRQKGLDDFVRLSAMLDDNCVIVLVGVKEHQVKRMPSGIMSVPRTESVSDLVKLYSAADVYISFSIEETFGMTIAESMACGTPAIVYNSTACPELLGVHTGFVVEPGDLEGTLRIIKELQQSEKGKYSLSCREHIVNEWSEKKTYNQYISLYKHLLNQ